MTVLEGSCHCGMVAFSVESYTPYPFNICHCITDTKTAGFYNCNIMGEYKTLVMKGTDPSEKKVYCANLGDRISSHQRHFCGNCGSALFAYDDKYPDPFATCIDSPDLPLVDIKDQVHLMVEFKRPCIQIPQEATQFQRYPNKSIEQWHKERGLYGTL